MLPHQITFFHRQQNQSSNQDLSKLSIAHSRDWRAQFFNRIERNMLLEEPNDSVARRESFRFACVAFVGAPAALATKHCDNVCRVEISEELSNHFPSFPARRSSRGLSKYGNGCVDCNI